MPGQRQIVVEFNAQWTAWCDACHKCVGAGGVPRPDAEFRSPCCGSTVTVTEDPCEAWCPTCKAWMPEAQPCHHLSGPKPEPEPECVCATWGKRYCLVHHEELRPPS